MMNWTKLTEFHLKSNFNKMIKKIFYGIVLVFTSGLILLSCSTSQLVREEEDIIIAKVNQQEILLEDFQNKLQEQKYFSNSPEEDLKKKEEALDELIFDLALKQKAQELDLSQASAFQQEKEEYMKKVLLGIFFENEIAQEIEVTDQEIEQFYQDYPEEFYLVPDKAKVSRILIKIDCPLGSPDLPQEEKKALDRILMIRQRIINGEDFSKLARELSEDGWSSRRGGNIGHVPRGGIIPGFEDFIFSANLNELSQPIRSPDGWNLLIVHKRIEGEKSELTEEARSKTREYLKKEKQNLKAMEYIERIKEETHFIFNEYALSTPDSLISDNPWVLIVNQKDTIWYKWYRYVWDAYKIDLEDDSLLLEYRKDILINSPMVINPLLRKRAKEKGYLNLPEYLEEEKNFTHTWAEDKMKTELKNEMSAYNPVEEEIYEYYLAHRENYPVDSSNHVYHILFEDSLLAEEARDKIIKGADFVEIAKKHHTEIEIRGNASYDLGFISPQRAPEELYKAAALLKEDQVSHPIRTEHGYHLIKVVERSHNHLTPYVPGIKIKLSQLYARQIKREWGERFREEIEIWVNHQLLKKIKLREKQKD
jgi:parvulin-like peptidyl-prolyl isomerase